MQRSGDAEIEREHIAANDEVADGIDVGARSGRCRTRRCHCRCPPEMELLGLRFAQAHRRSRRLRIASRCSSNPERGFSSTSPTPITKKATLGWPSWLLVLVMWTRTRVPGSKSIAKRCEDAGSADGPEQSEGRAIPSRAGTGSDTVVFDNALSEHQRRYRLRLRRWQRCVPSQSRHLHCVALHHQSEFNTPSGQRVQSGSGDVCLRLTVPLS